jgi:serine/threonine protein kinase
MPETALAEAIIGQQLNHPFILKNFGFGKGQLDYGNENASETVVYNLLEFVPEGEILEFVEKTEKFSEPTCRYFFK